MDGKILLKKNNNLLKNHIDIMERRKMLFVSGMWRLKSWCSTEDRWRQKVWISKSTFFRDDYCRPKTYFEEESCYIWPIRLPLRNHMKLALIQNIFYFSGDYCKNTNLEKHHIFSPSNIFFQDRGRTVFWRRSHVCVSSVERGVCRLSSANLDASVHNHALVPTPASKCA